jgi:hypothetical protein
MFQIINRHNSGLVLTNAAGEELQIGTLEALTQLAAEIQSYREKRGQIPYITTLEALAQAKAAGYDIPITTLNNACRNDSIPNVRKHAGRWRMPQTAFDEWFAAWKHKQHLHDNASE